SEKGFSAGCAGSSLEMLLDPRDVFLDRELRLLRVRGRRAAQDEQRLASSMDDQVQARFGTDDHAIQNVLRLLRHRFRGTDEARDPRSEGVHTHALRGGT